MERALVLTNAAAGGARDEAVDAAVAELRRGYDVEVAATSDADELRTVLAGRAGRAVLVIGGDGSVHAVVAALHERDGLADTAVGLVPLGTGNDLARGLGLPLDAAEAARGLCGATERRLDLLVEDGGQVVVNAVHVGVGERAAREARDLKARFGRAGYLLGALRGGFASPALRLRVVVDGQEVTTSGRGLLQVAVANGSSVGGGVPLAPDADHSDGLADVVVSYASSPTRRLAYALLARLGAHRDLSDVSVHRGVRIEVSGEPFRVNVDGELEGPFEAQRWTVRPGGLRFLLPPA